jgi:hypothetical protein
MAGPSRLLTEAAAWCLFALTSTGPGPLHCDGMALAESDRHRRQLTAALGSQFYPGHGPVLRAELFRLARHHYKGRSTGVRGRGSSKSHGGMWFVG